jgi:uncharacterized protein with FMN-binding domain
MNPTDSSRKKQVITAASVLVAITLIVTATVLAAQKKPDEIASSNTASISNASAATSSTSQSSSYKDGTYTADAQYQSPGGIEGITVKLTVSGGVVTESSITTDPSEREAVEYQGKFSSGYKALVVGKPLNSINLSRVSGSSLTSEGFNSAVAKIKQQAQA